MRARLVWVYTALYGRIRQKCSNLSASFRKRADADDRGGFRLGRPGMVATVNQEAGVFLATLMAAMFIEYGVTAPSVGFHQHHPINRLGPKSHEFIKPKFVVPGVSLLDCPVRSNASRRGLYRGDPRQPRSRRWCMCVVGPEVMMASERSPRATIEEDERMRCQIEMEM